MIKVPNCKCSLDDSLALDFHGKIERGPLVQSAAKALGISKRDIEYVKVLRRSVDARKRTNVHFVVMLAVKLNDPSKEDKLVLAGKAQPYKPYKPLDVRTQTCESRPVVVGLGPAGLFAAWRLAKAGLRPIVVERGSNVEKRQQAVQTFNNGGALDLASNIQFGEGGAGTFSDGKLTTGTKNPMAEHVLRLLYESGAPQDILIDAKPHIGSDVLPDVVKAIRNQIIDFGGEVLFETKLVDICFEGPSVSSVVVQDALGEMKEIRTKAVLLACGHSARDTFQMLFDRGLAMEQKPFSMGVRIEHLQRDLDESQYGAFADHPALGASEYKMAVHVSKERSAYTFCMCPGGEVVCAASEEGGVVTNGMSNRARDGRNSNAALLVNVDPSDFGGSHPLDGVRLQRKVEQAAFKAASQYRAPAQTVGDFLSGKAGNPSSKVVPTYARGVEWVDLHDVLPTFIAKTMEDALPLLDRKLRGFASPHAVMTAPETRSSSPVRICRKDNMQAWFANDPCHVGIGVFPCGEGPGYAGGIMSAAGDGLRAAGFVADYLSQADKEDAAANALLEGGTAVIPTDTVYGIAVSVEHADGPQRIFELKGRVPEKPVAWLVGSPDDLDRYGADVPQEAKELAKKHWPGALTIVVKAGEAVPDSFKGSDGTIGLRMPCSETALRIIRKVGSPLATSSANPSGCEPPHDISAVDASLIESVDAWLADDLERSGVSSTVISCVDGSLRVLREGDVVLSNGETVADDFVDRRCDGR